MRVLCINDAVTPGAVKVLKEGNVYTVVGERACECGRTTYFLSEINGILSRCTKCNRVHPTPSFRKSRFIPLSDIDETEMQRNYESQKSTA